MNTLAIWFAAVALLLVSARLLDDYCSSKNTNSKIRNLLIRAFRRIDPNRPRFAFREIWDFVKAIWWPAMKVTFAIVGLRAVAWLAEYWNVRSRLSKAAEAISAIYLVFVGGFLGLGLLVLLFIAVTDAIRFTMLRVFATTSDPAESPFTYAAAILGLFAMTLKIVWDVYFRAE